MIRSPIEGVVLQKYRELGDTINYGGEIQAGGGSTDIVQLADTTDMRTEVDINLDSEGYRKALAKYEAEKKKKKS